MSNATTPAPKTEMMLSDYIAQIQKLDAIQIATRAVFSTESLPNVYPGSDRPTIRALA